MPFGLFDKRFSVFKAFLGKGEVFDFGTPDKPRLARSQARARLEQLLRDAELKADAGIQDLILDRVGADTWQMVSEVGKLAAYMGERKAVQEADVKAIVASCRDVPAWDLTDAVGRRDLPDALALLRQLLFQKISPIKIVSDLAGRIQELLIHRVALDNGWLQMHGRDAVWRAVPPEADRLYGEALDRDPREAHPYRVSVLATQASHFTSAELQKGQELVQSAHEQMVTSSVPERLVLELLLVRILRR